MVTHSSTSRPVQCLCMAERTGCPVFTDLWSYVSCSDYFKIIQLVSYSHRHDFTHLARDMPRDAIQSSCQQRLDSNKTAPVFQDST